MDLLLASLILGIFPMGLYALLIWRLDRWEKEPLPLVLAAFLWGAVPSIIFSVIVQLIIGLPLAEGIDSPSLAAELFQASIVAPVTEEIAKAFGLALIFLIFRREINSILDGLIYGSMIGFGFSAIEDVLYFAGEASMSSLLQLFFFRTLIFGMLHALFTGLAGVGFALGKFTKNPLLKVLWPILGLAAAILTHALHNYFATMGEEHILLAIGGATIGFLWFIITVAVCLFHEHRWIQIQLSEEVEKGTLFAEQADDTSHFWRRSSLDVLTRGWKLVSARRHLLHQATELAYEKQRVIQRGPTPYCEQRIEALRCEVRELSRQDPLVHDGTIRGGIELPPPLPPLRRIPPPLPK